MGYNQLVDQLLFSIVALIHIFDFLGQKWAIFGVGEGLKTGFGSTHVVEQISFSTFSSILTFEFDLILGPLFTFGGPNGVFLGSRKSTKSVLGSTHVVEQFSC